jgi:sec-independent protein translocase protein TatA
MEQVHLPLLILMLDNPEWLIILAIVVVLFGGSRLGQLGGSLGQSIREFKRAMHEDEAPAPSGPAAATAPPPVTYTVIAPPRSEPASPPPAATVVGDYLPGTGRPPGSAVAMATAADPRTEHRPEAAGTGRSPTGA